MDRHPAALPGRQRPAAVPAHLAFGAAAEASAADWYVQHGYQVVDRNWRCREGELDLVVTDASTIVFVEVKARRRPAVDSPATAVDWAKQRRLRRAAARWLEQGGGGRRRIRFDVVAITGDDPGGGEIQVFVGAF